MMMKVMEGNRSLAKSRRQRVLEQSTKHVIDGSFHVPN